jgi:hypothetical protein
MAKANISTPRFSVAGFVSVQTPGKKYQSEEKEYSIVVAGDLDDPKVVEFITSMEELRDEFFEEVKVDKPKLKKVLKVLPIGKEETDDEGEPTGRILFKFKQSYEITSKKTGETFKKHVTLMDATGKPLPLKKKIPIGEGSIVRISFEPSPYMSNKDNEVGISFARLAGVKLLSLVRREGGASAASLGFGQDEDDIDDGFNGSDFSDDDDDEGADGEDGDGEGRNTPGIEDF